MVVTYLDCNSANDRQNQGQNQTTTSPRVFKCNTAACSKVRGGSSTSSIALINTICGSADDIADAYNCAQYGEYRGAGALKLNNAVLCITSFI